MVASVMRESRGLGPRIMLAAGLIAASGFALVSMAANLRFGISLATTPFDQIVYGTLSIAVDLVKIALPLAVALLWRSGERIFAIAGAVFWTGAIAFDLRRNRICRFCPKSHARRRTAGNRQETSVEGQDCQA
jgi:hypothetical protein